jgi:hypothetical protein
VKYGEPLNAGYIVTGDVPYSSGGKTLAQLMKKELIRCGVDPERIDIGPGNGIPSEAREVCEFITVCYRSEKNITIVSSDWYFEPGLTAWSREAKRVGLAVDYLAIRGTGGEKTRRFYRRYGYITRWARNLGAYWALAGLLNLYQKRRAVNGFQWDGCG